VKKASRQAKRIDSVAKIFTTLSVPATKVVNLLVTLAVNEKMSLLMLIE